MKALHAALLAHYQLPTTTLAVGWRVQRTDLQVFGWTEHDESVTIDGVLYVSGAGLQTSSTHSTNDFSVDTLDVTIFMTVSTETEIAAGIWDNAEVTAFEYNWASPPTALDTQVNILRHGNLGETKRQNNILTAEVRGLSQRLVRRIGRQYSPTCPWRHAQWTGTTYISSIECGIELAAHIVNGTITSIDGDGTLQFHDATRTEASEYFNEGLLTFTSGANAGITREVRAWDLASQTFALYRPFPFPAAVGNSYVAVRGDDKTFATCKDVFNNVANFGGFPHLPGIRAVYTNPVAV